MLSDLVGNFVERRSIPTPAQVFDFVSLSIEYRKGSDEPLSGTQFEQWKRAYTDIDAINLAMETFYNNKYLDVHCTVWTPDSFVRIFRQVNELGLMNIWVADPITPAPDEFVVLITKKGSPRIAQPFFESEDKRTIDQTKKSLQHAQRAFHECNDRFRQYIIQHPSRSQRMRNLWRRFFS
jgi:hypothetical protein